MVEHRCPQPQEDGMSEATDPVKFRLVDATGKEAGHYKLSLVPHEATAASVESERGYAVVELPELTPATAQILTQVMVRETAWPGAAVSNGAAYLYWTTEDKTTIAVNEGDGFPANMSVTVDGGNEVTFTLDRR